MSGVAVAEAQTLMAPPLACPPIPLLGLFFVRLAVQSLGSSSGPTEVGSLRQTTSFLGLSFLTGETVV